MMLIIALFACNPAPPEAPPAVVEAHGFRTWDELVDEARQSCADHCGPENVSEFRLKGRSCTCTPR